MKAEDAGRSESKNHLRSVLREKLTKVQALRHSYSLRAFARDLGIPAPVLSEVLRGKRPVTRKLAEKICQGMALSNQETDSILRATTGGRGTGAEYLQLNQDEFSMVSDWYYFAILSLAETAHCSAEPRAIGERLGIRKAEAQAAIATLLRLGLLQQVGERLEATGKQFTSTQDIPQAAIQKNHLQGLELAKEALRNVRVEDREFSANTIAFDCRSMAEAKKALREFRRKFSRKMTSGGNAEVYRLQIQFFPLSKKQLMEENEK
jgi:transcriptional regulator with XRE-family HTH domain